jgi:hypothetical protein
MTGAAARTSLAVSSVIGLFGFSRQPIIAALGTNSCNSASALAPSSLANALKPRPIEARNKPELHGIAADTEHDWDGGGRSLRRKSRRRAGCDDHGHSKLDEVNRQRRQSISLVSRPAIFNHNVAAFNVAGFVQAPPETVQPGVSDSGDPEFRYPITGMAACCARAASGHATAAPPSVAKNIRRSM